MDGTNNNRRRPPRYAATGGQAASPCQRGRRSFRELCPPPLPPPPPALPMPTAAPLPIAPAVAVEETWSCHKCDRRNLISKARCSSCQAWRGGRRQGYGRHTSFLQNFLDPKREGGGGPWTCPCGNENRPTKVRCSACQKWKEGRRDDGAFEGRRRPRRGGGSTGAVDVRQVRER
mmetsp:Transcript_1171/g.2906  ORF Transcript_1171/g.2906 Transcript_1171/m.2906 type:complete len:175 (+) Transcript_1171:197-721(+)